MARPVVTKLSQFTSWLRDAGIWNRDALLKVLEVIFVRVIFSADHVPGQSQVYFVTLVSHACVLVMAVGFLIYLLQLKDYHPIIARIQGWHAPSGLVVTC